MFTHFDPIEIIGGGVFCRFSLRMTFSYIHTDMFLHFDPIEMMGGRGIL
jgi:hypothetical protein